MLKSLQEQAIASGKRELRENRSKLVHSLEVTMNGLPHNELLHWVHAATLIVGKNLKIIRNLHELDGRQAHLRSIFRDLPALLRWESFERGIPVQPAFVPQKLFILHSNLSWESPHLTDAQWSLLEETFVSLHANLDYFRKYHRCKPLPSDRFLLEGILWKLSNSIRWQDLAGKYPVRPCRNLYSSLFRSGRMQTIYKILEWYLDTYGGTTLHDLVERGCFAISRNRVVFAPSGAPSWEKYTALLLLQQGYRARRSIRHQIDSERRRRGSYYRIPSPRDLGSCHRTNSVVIGRGGGAIRRSASSMDIKSDNFRVRNQIVRAPLQNLPGYLRPEAGRGELDQGKRLHYNDIGFDKYYYHKHKDLIMEDPKIGQTINKFLDTVKLARSVNTARSYSNGLHLFGTVLKENHLDPDQSPVSIITEDAASWMADALKDLSPATEQLYLAATVRFYEYLAAEKLADINLTRLRLLLRQRSRRPGQRLPQFPRNDIETVLNYVTDFTKNLSDNPGERLRALRDRSFLLTLADTGLRVHEACNLRRGDIDWNEGRAIIIGKGDKQAVVRFSGRSLAALRDYLSARAVLDGGSGRPLPSLPLFARHDKGAGKKIKRVTTTTGRNIVSERVRQALGDQAEGHITPHSFRHYFVTTVLRASGNLKLAQELARHASIQVTQRYAHLSNDELDKGYHDIFEK